MRQPTDKKFLSLLKKHDKMLRDEHVHLIQRIGRYGQREVAIVPNRIGPAPWLPASPKVNGVRMRYAKGKLVPRVS